MTWGTPFKRISVTTVDERLVVYWLFVCLFVCVLVVSFRSRIFHWYGDVTIMIANFDICLTLMAIEQWGFFSVSHLLWPGDPFIMVISEDAWHSHLLPSVSQWICFYDFGLPRLGFEHLRAERSNRLSHRCGCLAVDFSLPITVWTTEAWYPISHTSGFF